MDQRMIQDRNIGKNLRRLRLDAGLTQNEVAAKLQVMGLAITREIYAQIEAGTHHIRITWLLAMKRLFRAGWDEILPEMDLEGETQEPQE